MRDLDPCQVEGSTSFTQPSTSSKSQEELDYKLPATRENYPAIRFWDRQDWDQYLDSAEGHKSKRGTLGYLEDKNGDTPSNKIAKAIWAVVHQGWAQLVQEGSAPQSWGRLTASGHTFFHNFMEKAFPMFKLANNSWKLDYLASNSYSTWRKRKLDANCRWKKKEKGVKVEEDDDNDNDDEEEEEVGMKRKGSHCKSEGPEKKFKGACGYIHLQ